MVQFLSINFLLGFLQFLLGFSKVPVFCVTLYLQQMCCYEKDARVWCAGGRLPVLAGALCKAVCPSLSLLSSQPLSGGHIHEWEWRQFVANSRMTWTLAKLELVTQGSCACTWTFVTVPASRKVEIRAQQEQERNHGPLQTDPWLQSSYR